MKKEVVEGYRLSVQQRRLWKLLQESDAYRVQCAILLEGKLDKLRLHDAVTEVVRRHEILRTTYQRLPGMDMPIQVISETPHLDWEEVDLTACTGNELEKRIEYATSRARAGEFDYEQGPLVRFCLIETSHENHLLLVTLPSLNGDIGTLRNLADEIRKAYQFEAGDSEEEIVQYVQYSEWQNELAGAGESDAGTEFWRRLNNEPPEPLTLPLERDANSETIYRPAVFRVDISEELNLQLRETAAAEGVAEDVFLLAAWQTLLWRLTGQSDFSTALLYHGRGYEEMRDAFGAYSKWLPLRCHLEEEFQFNEILAQAGESALAAYEWQEYYSPTGDGDNESGIERSVLPATGFHYDLRPEETAAGGVRFSLCELYACIDRFKLTMSAWRRGRHLIFEIQYNPALYTLNAMALHAEQFQVLLEAVATNPRIQIGALDVIGQTARNRLLREFNENNRYYPSCSLIHQLIGAQADERPDAPAAEHEDQTITFGEMNRRANQLANYLRNRGVGPEEVVGILLDRGIDMIVSVLGIWKAGGAYVAIDTAQPPQRIQDILVDAGPRVVISSSAIASKPSNIDADIIEIDRGWEMIGKASAESLDAGVEGANLAYLIYTSGSTGRPKAVMIEHRSVVNLLWALEERLYEHEANGVRVSMNAPLVFDASVKQLIQLARGRTLVIVPEEVRRDADELLRHLTHKAVHVLDCTPSQLKLMREDGIKGLTQLKRILIGGEAIDPLMWEEMARDGRPDYWNVYGPTECTVDTTVNRVDEGESVSIGAGIGNVKVYLLDRIGRLVPLGAEGEIGIAGAGVARGYKNSPDRTAERFVPNPFGDAAGARLYLSGDIGKWTEEGKIKYVGRVDHQVKLRGNRIELGEIESVLREHGTVKEAVVEVKPDAIGEARLVAYVVPKREYAQLPKGADRWKLPNGITIAQDSRNDTPYLYEEIFERRCYMQHGIRLGKNACVFDVGANIGMFSLFMRENHPDARVYAFEPIKPIYEIAKMNMEVYCPQVNLFEVGLSTEEKWEEFTYYPEYSARSGVSEYADAGNEKDVVRTYLENQYRSGVEEVKPLLEELEDLVEFKGEKIRCRLRRLSAVMREEGIERIDLLKVDVQRAELDVLKGIDEEDWEKIDQITMEVHDEKGGASEGRIEEIRRLLEGKGYAVVAEQDDLLVGTDRHNLFAVKRGLANQEDEAHALTREEAGGGSTENVLISEGRNFADLIQPGAMEEMLRTYAKGRLPAYMVPSAIVLMEHFPLTRNGKIDRRVLPEPEEAKLAGEADVAPLETPYEEILAAMWEEVLGVSRVGADSNFFDSGGHSLLATQLMSRVREVFKVEIALRELFEEQTLRGLARKIEEKKRAGVGPATRPIERANQDGDIPLSFSQQRLWFLDQLEPGNPFYNCPAAVKLEGTLDEHALALTLTEIIRRHELLRTKFKALDGRPLQIVEPQTNLQLNFVDLCELGVEERRLEAKRLGNEEARLPFDIEAGPLVRTKLLKLAQKEHVLLYTMHHIVSDGWSMGVLMKEFAALYEAFVDGEPSPLPEPEVQYSDYALWQREWMQGDLFAEQVAYWKGQLAGCPPLIEIQTDYPRPAVQRHTGGRVRFEVSRDLTQRLKELSRTERTSLFMVLLAALRIELLRYSGQPDLAVGTPIAGRNRKEIEGSIGFFVNTLAIRNHVDEEQSYRDLLRREREVVLGAYANQEVPFEKLVEELEPARSLSHNPLFQVMLVMQNTPREKVELGSLTVSSVEKESGVAKFDLTVAFTEDDGRLRAAIAYDRDLYEESTVRRMADHYLRLLESITADPDESIYRLEMLTQKEKEQILRDWNASGRGYQSERALHQLIEEQVEANGDALAVEYEGEFLTYHELNRRANQLAHFLRKKGVGPEVIVGICVERSPAMVVGLLGTMKAGGAYLPLDPSYPKQRLAFMLGDAKAPVLLTQEKYLDEISTHDALVICLDRDWNLIGGECEDDPACLTSGETLAYVIYTSGSTGKPKGAMIQHNGLVNYLSWCSEAYDVAEGNGSIVHSSISFDLTVTSLYAPLVKGRKVTLVSEESGVEGLGDAMRRGGGDYSLIKITPAHLEVLSQQIGGDEAGGLTRAFIVGGENLQGQTIRFWQENAPNARIINEYGPTETVVGCCIYDAESSRRWTGTVPIGRPIANTTLYITGSRFDPTPVGVSGELFIGGDGVGRGYLDRPDLTARVFVPDPFASRPGARLYRTGDMARYLSSGDIECIGRIDNQVKVRGFRIELGEIESALNSHYAVRESVVVVREGAGAQKQLVGYVVLEENAQADHNELKAHLRERLPEHMVPVWIERSDELPLTPNGKVDRNALRDVALRRDKRELVAARNVVEEVVAGIWAEVLGLDSISIEDNFFNLGGHSLLATQVVSRVRDAFGVDVRLRSIFEHPTVSGFSEAVEQEMRRGKNAVMTAIGRADRSRRIPLSFAQRRLWFINQLVPDSSAYNIPAAVRLEGAMDISALRQALTEVVRRHEVLRTRFDELNGEPAEIIEEAQPVEIPITDLSPVADEQREELVKELADEEGRRPFDLRCGPLFRAGLIRVTDAQHVFLFTVHHIVSDGWSTGILIREIASLYNAFSAGRLSPLSDLPIQYADYAVWQREHLQGSVLEEQMSYWRGRLAGSPAILELPTDRPRPPVQTYRGGRVKFDLSGELAEQLKRLSRSERSSLFMTLLAALKVVLRRYSGQDDISVGTPIAGRTRREFEGLVGFFVNTLVIRSQLDEQTKFRDFLRRERELVLEAYANQDLPFEKLVEEFRPQRNTSHSPLFQVMMVMQNTPRGTLEMDGLKASMLGRESGTAKFDLTVSLNEVEGGLAGSIGFNRDLFDENRISGMAEHYVRLLKMIVADPDLPLWKLDMLPDAERSRLVESWNDTQTIYERSSCIHALLEEQAKLRGDAIALDCEGEQLTYDALNRRANQLAHYLIGKGVGPEVIVGVFIPRSLDLIVALVGILKAGGAYLPLDPSYPKERLAFMLEDSGARVTICDSRFLDSLPPPRGIFVWIDRESEEIAMLRDDTPSVDVAADNLGYVIYTSGSTGKPKGVRVVHRGVVRLVRNTNYATMGPDEVILQFAPIAFDASTFEVWGSLLNGSRLVLMPPGASSLEDLGSVVQRAGITTLWLTAALFQQMVDLNVQGLRGLRQLLAGGDVLPVEQVRKVRRDLPECRLINGYGPTENTTFSCCHTTNVNADTSGSIPIGVPVSNSQAYLLDQRFQPVPVGVRGELFAAGDGLARDYLNRPELTAEKFVPNPFGQPGDRAYRTGDIARYLCNGDIEFIGRKDSQIKVRGFRIELGEIEAVVGSHPAVREAVVLSREDGAGQKQLVCYVVSDSSADASAAALRGFLKQRLPDYMIPSWFEMLEQLPVTPNGKIDRKALPDAGVKREGGDLIAPRTPVEETVASIWKEVLRIDGDVSVEDDFFELGGHSLLATQVISRVRDKFSVEVPLRDLFQTPTIAALADLIGRVKASSSSWRLPSISRLERNAYRIKTPPPAPSAHADRVERV